MDFDLELDQNKVQECLNKIVETQDEISTAQMRKVNGDEQNPAQVSARIASAASKRVELMTFTHPRFGLLPFFQSWRKKYFLTQVQSQIMLSPPKLYSINKTIVL